MAHSHSSASLDQDAPALPVHGLLARKTYTIGRGTAFAGLGLLCLTTAIAGTSSWYILSKDDLAARLIARETARQYAYEDRIASLRADVDRLASRALLEQDTVEARVGELATRQAEIESKQSLISAVADTLQAGGLAPPIKGSSRPRLLKPETPVRASSVSSFAPVTPAKPMPAPDTPVLRSDGTWQSGELPEPPQPPAKRVAEALDVLDGALAQTAASQLETLRQMDTSLIDSQRKLRTALAETGLDPDRLTTGAQVTGGMGGPFVPIKVDGDAGPFEATLNSLQPRLATVLRLRDLVEKLPLRKPMNGEIDMTSNFGYRVDPFTRGPAMHTGIDFRGEHGSPVRVTAPGKVVTADYSGGYGNMVEVEHANGISTRYAHMSAISVSVGQTVQTGAVVGRLGSTGRSTGPHLHYETRIDGDAVNPIRFLKAGGKLDL